MYLRQPSDTFRILILKSVQNFSGSSGSLGSSRLSINSCLVPETANIDGWRHLTRIEPYFQGSYEKSVVGPGNYGGPKYPAVLDKSPATAYEYMIDLFSCTTANGIPSQRCMSGLWNKYLAFLSLRLFAKSKKIGELSSLGPQP